MYHFGEGGARGLGILRKPFYNYVSGPFFGVGVRGTPFFLFRKIRVFGFSTPIQLQGEHRAGVAHFLRPDQHAKSKNP